MNSKTRIWSLLITLPLSMGMSIFWNEACAFDLDNAYVEASYPLGYRAEGATSDGSTLWIMDRGPFGQESFALRSYDISDGGFSPISVIPTLAGVEDTRGLAWDGTNIWTSAFRDSYFKLDPTTGNIVDSFVSSTTGSPGGLTFDGQYLCKSSRPDFNQIDRVTGNIVNTISGFDLPGIEEGLTFDGQYLYAISHNDASDSTIWKIDPSTGTILSDSFALPYGTYNGLAFDGQNLWAVGWTDRTVYKISSTTVTQITIDIKSGSRPDSINPKSKGQIPVAILTTEDFSWQLVDPTTVRFGPGAATESHGRWHVKDVDKDGDMDLLFHFNTQETGIQCGDTEATLTAETWDGEPITGTHTINTIPCR